MRGPFNRSDVKIAGIYFDKFITRETIFHWPAVLVTWDRWDRCFRKPRSWNSAQKKLHFKSEGRIHTSFLRQIVVHVGAYFSRITLSDEPFRVCLCRPTDYRRGKLCTYINVYNATWCITFSLLGLLDLITLYVLRYALIPLISTFFV